MDDFVNTNKRDSPEQIKRTDILAKKYLIDYLIIRNQK